ncbi:AMP-binding enzyme C-terminal domain-containing protein, partial [Chryseolinea serpens]
GLLEYLGRSDEQVKVRGYRIEPGEIEHQLLQERGMKSVLVRVHDPEGDPSLCAYYVSEEAHTAEGLRSALQGRLPDYMVPVHYVSLASFPVTGNGKIDVKALPDPVQGVSEQDRVAPENEVEEKLVAIWAEVLKLDASQISVTKSFFALGGHSLSLMKVITKMQKAFSVTIKLPALVRNNTIRGSRALLEEIEKEQFHHIPVVAPEAFYPLTQTQLTIYLFQQKHPGTIVYNIPQSFAFGAAVDTEKVKSVFEKLIARHESLRTIFTTRDGNFVQLIRDDMPLEFQEHVIAASKDSDVVAAVVRGFTQPFDLETGPLLRLALIRTDDGALLLIDIHHIITDGISNTLLEKEFLALYQDIALPPLRVQYKDYAVWQSSPIVKKRIGQQEQYWSARYEQKPEKLNLPLSDPSATAHFERGVHYFEIDPVLYAGLKQLTLQHNATLFSVCFAAYTLMLSKLSGSDDIVVAVPASGRIHDDLQQVVGNFVNLLMIRNFAAGDKTTGEYLVDVNQNAMEAFENSNYEIERLFEMLNDRFRINVRDLIAVGFNFEPLDNDQSLEEQGVLAHTQELSPTTTPYLLDIIGSEGKNTIGFTLDYRSGAIHPDLAGRIASHYVHMLTVLVQDQHRCLQDIELKDQLEHIEHIDATEALADEFEF